MSETETTHTASAARPVVVEDDSPAGVPRAREVARTFADNLEPAPAAETAETLALVVSELATNALRHGGGRYRMRLHADQDTLHVAMSDPNPTPPRERTPDLNGGTGGFGWHMVRRLTSSIAITHGPGLGKTIHATLPR
ncbi:ATP-binding protein [Streptomyces sp. BB1-1-1]|uniref:ATP-binding protein n=1 Tax=Streptomyces sp. BB1-1-1 TaxID=3074430 RepID=UPI002877C6EF|nr:ATP-binding protein [Streptomyces sp. BB1-1-1]WND32922.1 ATP-binding protein [Streptomyces sp. BB1-1-1]